MSAGGEVAASVSLAIPQERMWRLACSLEGVNFELQPLLRMTTPRGLAGLEIDDVEAPVQLGRSWLLLGGVIPVDFDDLGIAELDPPRRFLERSRMLAMSSWEHERRIEQDGAGACVLSDRLRFELRRPLALLPGIDRFATWIVSRIFRHRHGRLASRYGTPEAG